MTREEKGVRLADLVILEIATTALCFLEPRRASEFDGLALIIRHLEGLRATEKSILDQEVTDE
jgi:hypothetical protein